MISEKISFWSTIYVCQYYLIDPCEKLSFKYNKDAYWSLPDRLFRISVVIVSVCNGQVLIYILGHSFLRILFYHFCFNMFVCCILRQNCVIALFYVEKTLEIIMHQYLKYICGSISALDKSICVSLSVCHITARMCFIWLFVWVETVSMWTTTY